MTGLFLLDWSILSLSLFNASLMLWLAATIALNAERPRAAAAGRAAPAWGTALIAASLLLGGLFFVSHSAILAFDLNTVSRGLNFWWQVGWWPVLALPLAWYVLVLWYAGYWGERDTALPEGFIRLRTTVEIVEPMGANTLINFRLGESSILVRLDGYSAEQPGDRLDLLVDMNRAVMIDPESERVI